MKLGNQLASGPSTEGQTMDEDRLFARIGQLFDVGILKDMQVLIAGCGSGGGQVALQLAMSGIRRFVLIDSDAVDVENVIRHVCGRRYLGQRKVDALADVLWDRNPAVAIEKHHVDLMTFSNLEEIIRNSDVVVMATDNEPTRYRINQLCVARKKAFVVGRVFTRGIGGEVFAYRPTEGGCLACLESTLERTQFREGIHEIDLLSDEEREKIYGMDAAEIKDSPGLNVDISFISSFHTRFVLDALAGMLPVRPAQLSPLEHNYIVWGNRPVHPFSKHFEIQRILLHKQQGCLICSGNGGTR